jgi:hypothetical protein
MIAWNAGIMFRWSSIVPMLVVNTMPVSCQRDPTALRSSS